MDREISTGGNSPGGHLPLTNSVPSATRYAASKTSCGMASNECYGEIGRIFHGESTSCPAVSGSSSTLRMRAASFREQSVPILQSSRYRHSITAATSKLTYLSGCVQAPPRCVRGRLAAFAKVDATGPCCGPRGGSDWPGSPNVRLPIPIAAFRAQGRLG